MAGVVDSLGDRLDINKHSWEPNWICSLPRPLLVEIFQCLPPLQVLEDASVCRMFQQASLSTFPLGLRQRSMLVVKVFKLLVELFEKRRLDPTVRLVPGLSITAVDEQTKTPPFSTCFTVSPAYLTYEGAHINPFTYWIGDAMLRLNVSFLSTWLLRHLQFCSVQFEFYPAATLHHLNSTWGRSPVPLHSRAFLGELRIRLFELLVSCTRAEDTHLLLFKLVQFSVSPVSEHWPNFPWQRKFVYSWSEQTEFPLAIDNQHKYLFPPWLRKRNFWNCLRVQARQRMTACTVSQPDSSWTSPYFFRNWRNNACLLHYHNSQQWEDLAAPPHLAALELCFDYEYFTYCMGASFIATAHCLLSRTTFPLVILNAVQDTLCSLFRASCVSLGMQLANDLSVSITLDSSTHNTDDDHPPTWEVD